MNKKLFLILILNIFLIGIISAQVSYCCERLENNGAWCQNAPEEECNQNYLSVPTSCEATSYCRLGVCINTGEGTCLPNTPQRVCTDSGGTWDEREKDEIPQCQLGCCLIGEQAAFTTSTRCKNLASIYGLEINYRTDVQNEMQCIAMASPKVKGACVFEDEYQRNCKMATKAECQEMEIGDSNVEFHEGYLCSAESLETICGPRGGTTCVEGKDEVYFLDTCGNVANVYDNGRVNDQLYWDTIIAPTCGDENGNPNSPNCGDCDYYLGSTCKRAERGNSPNYGNYICEDLSCEYEGENYQHGETWCVDVEGTEENFPGSRNFRMICYNGEVSVEPCADYRQEVCIQSEVNTFKTAACRVNMWQDCYSQTNPKDCENSDKRDCQWIEGVSILVDEGGNSLAVDENNEKIDASCVPLNAPGFDFWKEETDAKEMCGLASTTCYVEYASSVTTGGLIGEKGIPLDAQCMDKCREECLINDPTNFCNRACEEKCPSQCVNNNKDYTIKETWIEDMSNICRAMGDCGNGNNYIGEQGYYDEDDLESFVTRSSEEQTNE
jgi:hypothetical protein